MKYTNELQLIDTEEKAYLLGLFYSDGYVSSSSNCCAITLHNQDLVLLEKLEKLFPFFKVCKSHKNASKLLCTSKKLKEHLLSHGVFPQKSSKNKERLTINYVSKDLQHHFIRGYFDGDGSVYSQKLFNVKIEIGGTSYRLITEIIKILYENRIKVLLSCSFKGTGLRTMDYYKLYTGSYKVSKEFASYIYKDATIYMERKFNKLSVIPTYTKRKRIPCPICNSTNTIYNGFRNNKTRIHCKDCNKRSSILTAPHHSDMVSAEGELLEG